MGIAANSFLASAIGLFPGWVVVSITYMVSATLLAMLFILFLYFMQYYVFFIYINFRLYFIYKLISKLLSISFSLLTFSKSNNLLQLFIILIFFLVELLWKNWKLSTEIWLNLIFDRNLWILSQLKSWTIIWRMPLKAIKKQTYLI